MSRIGFLIIGAQKAGTTSLFEYMRRHPQIHMPAEKELYFFNEDRAYRRGLDWYRTIMLDNAPPGAVCGEATAEYMSGVPYRDITDHEHGDPTGSLGDMEPLEEIVPRRIKRCFPDVKLICVLRDPVARAYSHYRMMVLDRVESRSFEDAIEQLMEPSAIAHSLVAPTRTNGYIVNGEYARGFAGFLRVFPREQVMVIFSDELARQPAEILAKVFEFIGVENSFVPENLNTRYLTAAVKQRIPGLNLHIWRENLTRVRPVRVLWRALPRSARISASRVYGVIGYHIGLWNARRGIANDDMSPLARKRLIAHFRADSEALGDLLERDIPWLASWARS